MDVRPYDPADEEAVLALWAQQPEFSPSPLDRGVVRLGDAYDVQLVGTESDRVIAYGAAVRPPWVSRDGHVWIHVFVDRPHREGGLGADMWARVRAGIRAAEALYCSVSDRDDRSFAIAQRWGFAPLHHPIVSAVSWQTRPDDAQPPHDYRWEFLVDVRGLDRPDLDGMLAAADTSPESAVTGASTMAGFTASEHPVAAVVAHDGEGPVGAIFATGDGEEGDILLTAVHPDHRRRGLARALKQQMHRVMYDGGIRRLSTMNEESNTGIRELNRSLGYVRVRGAHRMRLML